MADTDSQADFWTGALTRTRFRRFTPAELQEQAILYFNWCNDNPLYETDLRTADGCVVETPVAKVRAFTKRGFQLWLGMSRNNWTDYANDPDYADIIDLIENVIYTQKFENAAAGLLNSTIIARDLNLSESVDHKSTDGSMTPQTRLTFNVDKLSDKAMEELLNATDDKFDK